MIETTAQTIYTGISTNPARRWLQHQGHQAGEAKYLQAYPPQKIILLLPLGDHAAAAKMEALLKKLSHQQKKNLAKMMAAQSRPYLKQWKLAF